MVAEPRAAHGVNAWPQFDVGDVGAHLRQGVAWCTCRREHPVEVGEDKFGLPLKVQVSARGACLVEGELTRQEEQVADAGGMGVVPLRRRQIDAARPPNTSTIRAADL
jgi:hypothetical protein